MIQALALIGLFVAAALAISAAARALRLPPGGHHIRLRYSLSGFRLGSGIALASFGLLAIAFARHRVSRKP